MSAAEVAWANFQNIPANVVAASPFILGFASIEVAAAWLRSMGLAGVDETSTRYMITNNLILGLSDTAKFTYWNNYQPISS